MIAGSIARRYAKALLALGVESKGYERFGQEIAQFAELLAHRALRDTLANPSHPLSKRKAIVEELLTRIKPSKTVWSFIRLLADRNRLPFLPAISREYQRLVDAQAGRVRAVVTTAEALDTEAVARLKKSLEQRTGKHVLLEQQTDPALVAGMVTQIGSIIYDGSIRTRLEQMRQSLLQGES